MASRRLALQGLAVLGLAPLRPSAQASEASLLDALRNGGAVLMLRHAQGFEAWVTHQVNITALTGTWVGMGEAVVIRGSPDGGTMLGRLSLGA